MLIRRAAIVIVTIDAQTGLTERELGAPKRGLTRV